MSRQHKKIFWPMLMMIMVAVAAFVFASARNASGTRPDDPKIPSTSGKAIRHAGSTEAVSTAMPQTGSERVPVQNVRFTLYEAGIFPRELHVKEGAVAIAIEDRTGNSAGLAIERVSANGRVTVGQVQRLTGHGRGRGQLQLEHGRYRVFDTSRPTNHAVLIVEP
jgi:hypothetical protein